MVPGSSLYLASEICAQASLQQRVPNWYVVRTIANHEKRACEQLSARSVENFLPTYDSVRRWKDRRVRLALPLFPGYLFVHLPLSQRVRVLEVPSVAGIVSFHGSPAPVSLEEIESLKRSLCDRSRVRPHPYLTVGRRVRVTNGPLAGLEGVFLRRRGVLRIVVSIHMIERSVAVDVDATDVEPVFDARRTVRCVELSAS